MDLIAKRSTDGRRTWSPHAIVHEEGGEKSACEALRLARFNLEWLTAPASP